MRNFLATLVTAVILASTAMADEADIYAGVKSVAVVSALGDRLWFCETSAHGVADANNTMPIADWNEDPRIEAMARDFLAKRFIVKDIAVDRGKLSREQSFTVDEQGHLKIDLGLEGLSRTGDVDAIVAIVKKPAAEEIPCQGLGLVRRLEKGATIYSVYTGYMIVVLKGSDLDFLSTQPETFTLQAPMLLYADAPDAALWPQKAGAPTPQQKDAIRKLIDQMLDQSIPATLSQLHMPLALSVGPRPQ